MFLSYSKRIFFLSFLALSIFLQSTPAIAMEEKTLRRIDLQTKPRWISENLDTFYENAERFEDLFDISEDSFTLARESLKWLGEEYAKEDGNPKAKLIYSFAAEYLHFRLGDETIQLPEWHNVYEWLKSQGDDPAALYWLGRYYDWQCGTDEDTDMDEPYYKKAKEFYMKALEKGSSASCNSLGDLYMERIYYAKLNAQGLKDHQPEAQIIKAHCLGKAYGYFLQGSQSQDTTTRYHAYKSLMNFYFWPLHHADKRVYWCIKVLDILPDYFLSRLYLSDLVSENQIRLRRLLFPALYKPNEQQSAANDAITFKNEVEQRWLKSFEDLKSISFNTSLENAKNEFKIIYNEEAKDREHYEKFSFTLEKAVYYLPLALEKEGFIFMTPKKVIQGHLHHNFSVYDPMNPASSDELALRVYPMGYGDITIAFGNENVQFCDKVMDLLQGPYSLSSLINYHKQEIQLATTDLEIAEHVGKIESLKNIIQSFNDMLLVVNPAKVEQFKQTYGFLADMFG